MMGIIATIIAIRKRHFTFAWVIGIWTGIAIILALCGMAVIAIAPGWLFLAIAIGMKKIPEDGEAASGPDIPSVNAVAASTPLPPSATTPFAGTQEPTPVHADDLAGMVQPSTSSPAIRFCRYCGQELEVGAKFCRHCGAQIE